MHNGPIYFNGNSAKTLVLPVDINGNAQLNSGSVDPSSSATTGTVGSLYQSTSTGYCYQKGDAGSSTTWKPIIAKRPCFSGATTYSTKFTSSSSLYNLQFNTSTYNQVGTNSAATVSTQNLTTTSGSATATAASGAALDFGQTAVSSNLASNTSIANISGNTITLSANATGTGTVSTVFSQWKWTAPIAGIYRASYNFTTNVVSPSAEFPMLVVLRKNSSDFIRIDCLYSIATSVVLPAQGCVEMQVAANDTFYWQLLALSVTTLSASAFYTNCSFSYISPI